MERNGSDESGPGPAERGMRAALAGIGLNAVLVAVKLLAGILGHS